MIYLKLFIEFFKIGLFAVGGGLVTIPFLFDLSEKYNWYTKQELMNMMAISQSTPGPMGVNMATYAGYTTCGIWGGVFATLSLVMPSVIVIYFVARALDKWQDNIYVQQILAGIRPAVLALILFAGLEVAREAIIDIKSSVLLAVLLLAMRFYRKSVILYIVISAIAGLVFKI